MSLIRRATPSSTSTSCYTLNKQKAPSDSLSYIPCNATAIANGEHSVCCASNDLCLENGLCKYNAGADARPFNEYWRIGCTDPTYKDPSCPQQCSNIPNDRATQLVFQCPGNGRWCCGTGHIETYKDHGTINTTCCDIDDLAFDGGEARVFATAKLELKDVSGTAVSTGIPTRTSGLGQVSTTVGTIATSTSLGEGRTAVPSASDNISPPKAPDNLSTAIGIGVGIPVTIAILIGIAVFFVLRKRRKAKAAMQDQGTNNSHFDNKPLTSPPNQPSPTQQSQSKRGAFAFWNRSRSVQQSPASQASLDSPDIRSTNPHAFWTEAHGREMAMEMDSARAPAEAWSPDAERGTGWGNTQDGRDINAVELRGTNARERFGNSELEANESRSPELPAYAYKYT
ncbi:unnamed protein product [Periconia digitata]|uniref:Uncharacterized protein n=1 Tax=Periconia digitata TaxID=1303443 RepID=A0A9W4UC10_9PLEO|nr:unnamed protein product [Periconia digitata]